MTGPRYRAVRFALEEGVRAARGLRLDRNGALEMVDDDAAVRQAILLLVSTRPGERVMRPGYGCDLQRLVFSPNDDTTAGLAVHYVRRALETWEPRVDVLALGATRDESGGGLVVTLEYRVRSTQRRDRLELRLPLAGGAF